MAQVTQPISRTNERPSGLNKLWASHAFQDRLTATICTIVCIGIVIVILVPNRLDDFDLVEDTL